MLLAEEYFASENDLLIETLRQVDEPKSLAAFADWDVIRLTAQNRDQRHNFEHWLGGMISYVQMVNPDKGKRLRDAFNSVSS